MSAQKPVKRLILHAGLPKTATTSIQNTLFAHRDDLFQRLGIYYPGSSANHTNALCTAFLADPRNHISNKIAGLTDLEELRQKAAEIRRDFAAEIAAAAPQTVLFSAEGMSNLGAVELAGFRDWARDFAQEISVLYIVRNPIGYTASVAQQHLKGGEVLEDMYENPPLANWKGRIGAAINAFGRDAISVRTFEDMVAHAEGVVGFFLDAIGVAPGPTRTEIVASQVFDNESLSHEAALILSSLNRQRPPFRDGERAPLRTMTELGLIEKIRGVKFHLPDEVKRRVAERSAPDLAWLKETFGIDRYDGAADIATGDAAPTLSPQTIDSLAVLLSNLINDRHVNSLIQRAQVRRHAGGEEELRHLAAEIRRITPARPLPEFLERFLA